MTGKYGGKHVCWYVNPIYPHEILVSLLVLEKQAGNSCSKWELMTASKRLKKLAGAIDELVEQED